MRRNQDRMSDIALLLHRIIQEQPGIHFRSLGRAARLSSVGQLRHHLDHLRRQGAIVEVKDGRFKRFFVAGAHDPQLRQGLARFARRVPRRIGTLLLTRPMNRTELRRSLDCADSTLGYHLNRMVALGDLVRTRGRNCCMYSLAEPDFVRDLLRHQAPSSIVPRQASEELQEHAEPIPSTSRPLAPEYTLRAPGADAPSHGAAPGAEHPGRGIKAVSESAPSAPASSPPARDAPAARDEDRPDGDEGGGERAGPRPAGRVHVVPRKPPEILAWHGQR